LPAFLRRLGWRAVMANPRWFKRFGGTVGLTSVGMFGTGTGTGGGWGIVMTPPTLMVVVGGISTEPRLVAGQLQNREFLHVTLSFDHDLVDGAPAARFAARLGELVENADGLEGAAGAAPAAD
jgi:pyruvate/2-oxoglutarate dehydrogenase complex dihydrolipoamide acyltransferase (E2) component